MAAVVVWRSQHRRNLTRNRVFRDRKNPLDMYDDGELYDKCRFRRHDILTIVDELLDDLSPAHTSRRCAWSLANYPYLQPIVLCAGVLSLLPGRMRRGKDYPTGLILSAQREPEFPVCG